jgi:hypothetical protein
MLEAVEDYVRTVIDSEHKALGEYLRRQRDRPHLRSLGRRGRHPPKLRRRPPQRPEREGSMILEHEDREIVSLTEQMSHAVHLLQSRPEWHTKAGRRARAGRTQGDRQPRAHPQRARRLRRPACGGVMR